MVGGGNMKIRIDTLACGNPLECRLCLDRCPGKVFGTYPRRRRERGTPAGDWVIFPLLPSQCVGCMECVSFCPRQAILVQ
jgi:NAD-dependent dihydropyrimidine dehydrogenase PreA subunit